MITWLAFIGKLLEFTFTKILGKKVDISMDEKKRACKIFLKLHKALTDIEAVNYIILQTFEPYASGEQHKIYSWRLKPLSEQIDASSRNFLDALYKSYDVANIYDPNLGRLFGRIAHYKEIMMNRAAVRGNLTNKMNAEFLIASNPSWFLSDNALFKLEWSENKISSISYNHPNSNLDQLDWEEHYQWIEKNFMDGALINPVSENNFVINNKQIKWPQNVLFNLLSDGIIHEQIKLEDIVKVRQLYFLIKHHLVVISSARETLRKFISNQFSLEDLLYVSEKIKEKENLASVSMPLIESKAIVQINQVPEKLVAIIVGKLGIEVQEVTPEASFIQDLGADSLDSTELIMEFEKEYGVSIPDEDAKKIQTVGDVMMYLDSKGLL